MQLKDVQEGDDLVADAGFNCTAEGDHKTVHANGDGELYIPCADGKHFLDGQADESGKLVGLTKSTS